MTRFCLTLLALLSSMAVHISAAGYQWLTFTFNDNSELAVAADDLQIAYSDNTLVLTSPTVQQTLPLSTLRSMRFTRDASGVDQVAANSTDQAVTVYNLQGIKVGEFQSRDGARSQLPSGTYILKTNSACTKIIF